MNSDTKLVQACRSGDVRAFEAIVSRYQALICAITYSAVGNRAVSEELAQETFVQAWRKLAQLKEPDKCRAWLCGIARSIVCNHRRSENRRPMQYCDPAAMPTEPDLQTPPEMLIRQEEEVMIQDALMQIPDAYREPLVLFYRQEQSVRQVAELMGLTEATARTRLHRARQMLRQQVESRIETTLKKTAPGPAFTRSVMGAVGAGLAAGVAGTVTAAGVTAATGGGAGTTAVAGLLTSAAAKTTAAVAAILITAGVAVYTHSRTHAPSLETETPDAVRAADTHYSSAAEQFATADSLGEVRPMASFVPTAPIVTVIAADTPEPLSVVSAKPASSTLPVRHPDWPGLDEPIQHIYVTSTLFTADGKAGVQKFWARLPDAFRDEEQFDKITIDNGKERLVLDPNTLQAQLEPSWFIDGKMVWQFRQFLEEHPTVVQARLFRDPNSSPEIRATLLTDDSTSQISVYNVEAADLEGIEFTAWVDTRTLLPERIEAIVIGEPNQHDNLTGIEAVFDFSPIPDSVFSTAIPADYEALPPKQPNSFSGWVIDLLGHPVPDAEVYLHCWTLGQQGPLKTQTNPDGEFTFSRPPHEIGFNSSVAVWAVLPDAPEFFGWTMLLDPWQADDIQRRPLAGAIPGSPGIIHSSEGYFYETTENGYRISGIWCVGASEIVLVMEPGIEVFGTIQDIYGVPVSGLDVYVNIDGLADVYNNPVNVGPFPATMIHTQTSEEGLYAVYNAPSLWKNCSVRVFVKPTPEMKLVGNSRALHVEDPNAPLRADFVLLPQGPTVRGIVVDNYGTPLAGRYLYICVDGKTFPGYTTKTHENGRFEFVNCPADAGLEIRAILSHNSMAPHEPETYLSYVYYPDVTINVGYRPEQPEDEYDVTLTAILPELVIEAVLVDSAGNPLPFFPVEIRADESISTQWKQDRRLHHRTDENGVVTFVNVPEMRGLRLVCTSQLKPWTDREERGAVQDYFTELDTIRRGHFRWTEVAVPLEPDHKNYAMVITVFTNEEWEQIKPR